MLFYMLHSSLVCTRLLASNLVRLTIEAVSPQIQLSAAAYFVQTAVSCYERYFATFQAAKGEEDSGKECSNLIVLLSELYNFQVISSVLVFDIIRGLLVAGLSEFIVELLLKIARSNVGIL